MTDGPLSAYDPVDLVPARAAEAPVSFGEVFSAARTVARSDRSDASWIRLQQGWQPLVDALGLNEADNPAQFSERQPQPSRFDRSRGWVKTGFTRIDQKVAIFDAIRERQRRDPTFLRDLDLSKGTPAAIDAFEKGLIAKERDARAAASGVVDRGEGFFGGLAAFAGGAAETTLDPLNLITLPLGGGGKTVGQIFAREALLNGAIEAVQQPIVARNRETLGVDFSLGEAAENVGMAAVGGGVIGSAGHVAWRQIGKGVDRLGTSRVGELAGNAYDGVVERVFNALPESVQQRWMDAATIPDEALPELIRGIIGADRLTPDEASAVHVIERQAEVDAASPFVPGSAAADAHGAKLGETIAAMLDDYRVSAASTRPAIDAAPPAAMPVGSAGDRFMAAVRGVESAGDDGARNPRSTATGRYQFTDATWLSYYKRRFGGRESDAAILAKRADGAVQDALMRDLTADNSAALARMGEAETAGNLYLLHFAGEAGGRKLLKADPDTPIEALLGAKAVKANPFLAGKTAGDVIAWAHRKMGEANIAHDRPVLRRDGFTDDAEWRAAQAEIDAEAMARTLAERAQAPERAAAIDLGEALAPWGAGARAADETVARVNFNADAPAFEAMRPARSFADARGAAGNFQGAPLRNVESGLDAVVSRNTLDKMLSAKAVAKSTSARDHVLAVANLDELFPRARLVESGPDKRGGGALAAIHRFHAPMNTPDGPVDVRMTVKETRGSGQNPLYTVETIAVGKVEPASVSFQKGTSAPDLGRDVAPTGSAANIADNASPRQMELFSPGARDEAEAGRLVEIEPADAAPARQFADPDGEGAAIQADSLDHDLRMAARALADDAGDQAAFRLDDDGQELRLSDALTDLDEDEAMVAALKACMKPGGAA